MNSGAGHRCQSTVQSRAILARLILAAGLLLALTWHGAAAAPADPSAKVTYPQVSEAASPAQLISIPGKAGALTHRKRITSGRGLDRRFG